MREPTYNELYTNTHEGQGKTSGMRGQRPTATRQRRLQTWEFVGRTEHRTHSGGEVYRGTLVPTVGIHRLARQQVWEKGQD